MNYNYERFIIVIELYECWRKIFGIRVEEFMNIVI